MSDLYRKYRPRKLEDLVGQRDAVAQVSGFVRKGKVPPTLMFTGPSGTGKTTVARILRKLVGCSEQDYVEINAASSRGIDTIREIEQRVNLAPIGGKSRMWVLDESHAISTDASNAALKVLEDQPGHVYFVLCTTRPEKMLDTIHTRCRKVAFSPIAPSDLGKLIDHVCEKEGEQVSPKVSEAISESADGSARRCLQLLGAALDVGKDEEAQLRVVRKADVKRQGIDLARILFKPRCTWDEIRAVLEKLDDQEEAESLRYKVLGYANAILVKGGPQQAKAAAVIGAFEFSVREGGMASLSKACWQLFARQGK